MALRLLSTTRLVLERLIKPKNCSVFFFVQPIVLIFIVFPYVSRRSWCFSDRRSVLLMVETWSYDPAGLSDGPVVDPLSLYMQFHDHQDERIAIEADKLL